VSRSGERGAVTLWLLGLCLALLALGGLAVDLGRGFSERRALHSAADSAALAGAGAIDEAEYRASGRLVLVPALAEATARADVARQLDTRALRAVRVAADRTHVEVVLAGEVHLSLLRLLAREPFVVEVRARAVPRRSS
jgi:uncharacterized membrane protein